MTGVDRLPEKVRQINSGRAPVKEEGLDALTTKAVKAGLLSATVDIAQAVRESEVSIICVGTPSRKNGNIDLTHLEEVCSEIGEALAEKEAFHVVVVRSTIIPGTMRKTVIPALERASGKKSETDFGVCHNPEFLREGSAIADFRNPARTVIGVTDLRSGNIVQTLYEGLPGLIARCSIEKAEMVKYADNAWHAAKTVFANEIGRLCKAEGIDSHEVMDIFCQDTKLNLSKSYLKPGFAFGGSCLPKDLRALNYKAKSLGIMTPLLDALLDSNRYQTASGLDMIVSTGKKSIGFLGYSFKAGTDDIRESPVLEIIRWLRALKFDVRLYDGNVEHAVPDITPCIVKDIDSLLGGSEVIVIGTDDPEFAAIAGKLRQEQTVIDFVRIREIEQSHANYKGIVW